MPTTIHHETGEIMELTDPEAIAKWMADGWRFRWNQHRAARITENRIYRGKEPNENVWHGTDSEARTEFGWLKDMPAMVLQSPGRLEKQDWFTAIKRKKTTGKGKLSWKFKRRHESLGFVCWHNKGVGTELVKLNRRTSVVWVKGNGYRLGVRFRHSPNVVVRDYTSIQVNLLKNTVVFVNSPKPLMKGNDIVGVDVGVVKTVATSNDETFSIPRPSVQENRQYKSLQRKMARQDRQAERDKRSKWESKRRVKTVNEIQRLAALQTRRRHDWVEKTTTRLIQENQVIVLEDLSPARMSKKGKGKAGLNRGILESCWGLFQTRLKAKAELAGVELIWVNPAYTSQMCNECGHVARGNRENQASFSCVKCGHTSNADLNAARNIRDIGLGHSLRRGVNVRPVKDRRLLVSSQSQAIALKRQTLGTA